MAATETGRLGVGRQLQVILAAGPHQPRKVLRQGIIDLLEHFARGEEIVGQCPSHADELRALPGEDEGEVGQAALPVCQQITARTPRGEVGPAQAGASRRGVFA
jgi:hypothetical protein